MSTDQQVNYGLNHYRMGLYGQAIPALMSAASSLEKTDPPDPRLPQVLSALGNMAESDKRYDLARGYYGKGLKAAESLAPPNETLLRNALVDAGHFHLGQKSYTEALPLLERAAAISGKNPRFRPVLQAIDVDNLGLAYAGLGRHAEANALSQRALGVLEKASDTEALKTRGVIFYNLGYSYMEQGRNREAETYYRRALDTLAPPAGPSVGEPWRVKVVVTNYAALLRKLGRNAEAEKLEARIPAK